MENYITSPSNAETTEKCVEVMKTSTSPIVLIAAIKYFSQLKQEKLLGEAVTSLGKVSNKPMVNGYFWVISQSFKANLRIAGLMTLNAGNYTIQEVSSWANKSPVDLKILFADYVTSKVLPEKLIDFLISYSAHLPIWVLSFCQKANIKSFLASSMKYKNPNTETFIVRLYVSYFIEQVAQKQKTNELMQTLKLNEKKYIELITELEKHIMYFPNIVDHDISYYVLKSAGPIKSSVCEKQNFLVQHHDHVVIDVLAKDGIVLEGSWNERLEAINTNKASLTIMNGQEVLNLLETHHLCISPVTPTSSNDRFLTFLKKKPTNVAKKRKMEDINNKD